MDIYVVGEYFLSANKYSSKGQARNLTSSCTIIRRTRDNLEYSERL